MTNSEIFRRAADYIREHGWIQGSGGEHGGPRCAEGALVSVCIAESNWERIGSAWTIASQRVGPAWGLLRHWNDGSGRTTEEVLALLDGLAFDEDLKAAAQSSPLPADETIPGAVQILQLVEA